MKKQNDKGYIPRLDEFKRIRFNENGEPLIHLREVFPDIHCEYRRKDSEINEVLVRCKIANKLHNVQKRLQGYDKKMNLLVVEGYRSPFYQERYFLKQFLVEYQKDSTKDLDTLTETTHQFVALPSVAGHPTGGAVDLTITYGDIEVDMGGKIADFSIPERLPTYSSLITSLQAKNRSLLHDLMIAEGFAPYYGEWWHFSYGDREWASFYGLSESLYAPIYSLRNKTETG